MEWTLSSHSLCLLLGRRHVRCRRDHEPHDPAHVSHRCHGPCLHRATKARVKEARQLAAIRVAASPQT